MRISPSRKSAICSNTIDLPAKSQVAVSKKQSAAIPSWKWRSPPAHLNAQGNVMGGAIFTLGDFATAIAGNIGQDPSISTSANIRYLTIPKGKRLIATCTADRMGRSLGSFTVKIQDDLGNIVAIMTSTLYRLSHE
mgnify:CR=1 FL=1